MTLLFLSEELNWCEDASENGNNQGDLLGISRGQKDQVQLPGSEKGDTLPVFWCPSSIASPSR